MERNKKPNLPRPRGSATRKLKTALKHAPPAGIGDGREPGHGVIGKRGRMVQRIGDAHIDFSISELKSKAPPFKNRRTGHLKFNYKGRATRPRGSYLKLKAT